MTGERYDSVPVRVERRDDQGMYVIGVVIDNAFIPIAQQKTGYVDEVVERERVAAEQSTSDVDE